MALFATCTACGEKMLSVFIGPHGLCHSCQKSIEQQKEIEDRKNAEDCYLRLEDALRKAENVYLPDTLEEAIEGVKIFQNYLNVYDEVKSVPYLKETLFKHCKRKNGLLISEVFGEVSESCQGTTLNEIYDKVSQNKNGYQKVVTESQNFLNLLNTTPVTSGFVDPGKAPLPRIPSSRVIDFLVIETTNLTARTSRSSINDFYAVDTETTGLTPGSAEIIQIAAAHFVDFELTEVFSTYVKPKNGISARAFAINHISEEKVKDAPPIEEAICMFDQFANSGKTFVGHNLQFDAKFLYSAGSLLFPRFEPKARYYDTLELSRKVYTYPNLNDYKLPTLCKVILGILRDSSHDAVSDSVVAGLLFKDICETKGLV